MNTPTVLLYNLEGGKAQAVKLLCAVMKTRPKTVSPKDYSQPISALLGLTERQETGEGDTFSDEMLVMSGFSQDMLNSFLLGFRRKKIPPVALKAMITPTNLSWTSLELHAELVKEHAAMTQGDREGKE